MKKLFALFTLTLFTVACTTTPDAEPVSLEKSQKSVFNGVQLHNFNIEAQDDGDGACVILWDFNLTNNQDVLKSAQPILTAEGRYEGKKRVTNEYLQVSTVPLKGIRRYEGITYVNDCRKGKLKKVYISDIVVDDM